MTATEFATLARGLLVDTFRQARSSRVSWLMLGVSALFIALCLSVRIEGRGAIVPEGEIELYGGDDQPLAGPDPRPGHLSLAFGGIRLGLFRGAKDEVRFLQVLLAKWVAGAAGTLLMLVWTAGLLPEFLRPDASAVLLTKPAPRWALLLGKVAAVLALAGVQGTVFVVGTWLALGLRTGFWEAGYLLALPLLLLHFAVIYSFSTLLAVTTRNTVACAFGSIMFWAACFGMNYGRHAAVAHASASPGGAVRSPAFGWATEAAYWVLPKPADLVMLLDRALGAGEHFRGIAELDAVQALQAFHPSASVAASALFAAALFAVSAREFTLTDY